MDVGVMDQRFSLSEYWQGKSLVSRVSLPRTTYIQVYYDNNFVNVKQLKYPIIKFKMIYSPSATSFCNI